MLGEALGDPFRDRSTMLRSGTKPGGKTRKRPAASALLSLLIAHWTSCPLDTAQFRRRCNVTERAAAQLFGVSPLRQEPVVGDIGLSQRAYCLGSESEALSLIGLWRCLAPPSQPGAVAEAVGS